MEIEKEIKRRMLEILLHDIPIENVFRLLRKNSEQIVDFQEFYSIAVETLGQYSKDEIYNLFGYLCELIDVKKVSSIFGLLGKYCSELLVYDEYEPKIRYKELMKWRKLSFILGQDLPITAFLAYRDFVYEDLTEFFSYRSVIKTNNQRLHNILSQGMAENHFHLKGSTKVFDINWMSLMNHPFNRSAEFRRYQYLLRKEQVYKEKDKRYSLYMLIRIAAVIRMYLFLYINMDTLGNEYLDYDNDLYTLFDCDESEIEKYMRIIYVGKSIVNFNEENDLDYALKAGVASINENANFILAGERKLLYQCINNMMIGKFTDNEACCFYAYILIKSRLRDEMIQINQRIGFENFSEYETRKEIFIDNYPKYEEELIKLAVINTCADQDVVSLEARITPKDSAIKNIQQIIRYDDILNVKDGKLLFNGSEIEFYYVYHFVKKKEKESTFFKEIRNISVRNEVEIKARALALALEESVCFRKRVKGIDACNNENFCRPEVFAQAFRFLHGINISSAKKYDSKQEPLIINMTYHAGEDYLDIVDGLRAIDEVITYCGFDNQCRIGHAIALGIDVERYYSNKTILTLTKQCFLDNIAWLISKCNEFDIDMKTSSLNNMKKEFDFICKEVYGELGYISVDMYYDAWKLRGDNPLLYQHQYYKKRSSFSKYTQFDKNRMIESSIRKNKNISKIYSAYHFNENVRKHGNEKYMMKVECEYIRLVKMLQKKMQFDIARKGIMIECNPTSNYLIAKLGRYENHPILQFYNYELSCENKIECAQICSSINTDDQGIFETSLENEYALMAYALENAKDTKGSYLYTPTEVYKWIDSVRKMGLQQKFK